MPKSLMITDRQKKVLEYMKSFIAQHGYPPTLLETAKEMDISGTGVLGHLLALERKGYISRASNVSRGIKILKDPPNDL